MTEEIVNKVTGSGIITIDPADFFPTQPRKSLDLSTALIDGMLLREKDFRQFVATHDWSQYSGCLLTVHCTTDALIQSWAWMLVAASATPYAQKVYFSSPENAESMIWGDAISNIDIAPYIDQKVVIKGCGPIHIPGYVYGLIAQRLTPVVQSIMYGEPCSTVPVYKKQRN